MENIESHASSVAAIVFLFIIHGLLSLGLLGVNFLLETEIGPQDLLVHYRAFGTATNWLCNSTVAEITPVAFSSIGR